MSFLQIPNLVLRDDNFPLLTETIISQQGIEKNSSTIPFSKLIQLNTALDALQPIPPNATTMWIDNTILLDTASSPNVNTNTINNTSMTITDLATNNSNSLTNINSTIFDGLSGVQNTIVSGGMNIFNTINGEQLNLTFGGLVYNSSTSTTNISNDSGQNIDINAGGGINLISNTSGIILNSNIGNKTIELNSVDIVSNCNTGVFYTLPIQFTNKSSSNYTYSNINNWEMVATSQMGIPLPLFTDTNGYNVWKMDFAINCWNMTDQNNKAYAMYIEIRDVNGSGNDYTGFLFNQNTPYTTHKLNSTYNFTNNNIENYIYTDYFDLSNATGSPLEIRLWRFADSGMSCDFNWLITLSKTNLV
jgi:hypothetical protein